VKPAGGAIVALSCLGSTRVIPNYNVTGVAKASLGASGRYLAADLGPLFMLSPMPRGIPGQVLYVDGGFCTMGD